MDPLAQYLEDKGHAAAAPAADPLADYLAQKGQSSAAPAPLHINKEKLLANVQRVKRKADEEQAPTAAQTADEAAATGAGGVLSIADRASFGGLSALLRAAKKVNELTGETGPTLASRSLQSINDYRGNLPTVSQYTDMPAYFMAPTQAVAGGIESALPVATKLGTRAARSVAASGLTGAALAGNEAALRGEGLEEGGRHMLEGGAGGALMGSAVAAPVSVASMAADALLGSRGAAARRFLESRGVPVSLTSSGRSGHITDADIGAASQRADTSVKEGLEQYRHDVATKPYVAELGKVSPAEANQLVDVTGIFANMAKAAQHPSTRPEVAAELQRQMDMMTKNYVPGSGPIMMTQDYLNGLRRSLGEAAKFDSMEPKLSPIKRAFADAKALVDQGPYAEANRRFTEGTNDAQESLDMLDLRRTKNRNNPIAGNLRVTSQRRGQNTVTAGADQERLDVDAFRAKHPGLALELDEPQILRHAADLNFKVLPSMHGGLIERSGSAAMGAAALEGLYHLAAHGHVSPTQLAASALLGLGARNMTPIAGRALYNPAMGTQALTPQLLGSVPLVGAARAAQQEQP